MLTSLLDGGDEVALEPSIIVAGSGSSDLSAVLVDLSVPGIGVLSGGVVSPDGDASDLVGGDTGLGGDLGGGSVLIESGEGREVLLGDGGRVFLGNQAVGVGGVADNEDFDGLLGDSVQKSALGLRTELTQNLTVKEYLEDFSVLGEHIVSLHTGLSGESTNKNGDIDVSEGFSLVAGSSDGLQAWEGAILRRNI